MNACLPKSIYLNLMFYIGHSNLMFAKFYLKYRKHNMVWPFESSFSCLYF